MRQNGRERGQVVIMMLLAMSIFLIGAIGLAIDGSNLYAQRQMAQAAADASAQAGVTSIFGGTWDTTSVAGGYTCANGTDPTSPCGYARLNGFGTTGSSDSVDISFPSSVPGVTLSPNPAFPQKAVQAIVTRSVPTTLMRFLGPSATTVNAIGVAAIMQVLSPVPILVLHPTKDQALYVTGDKDIIKICGGPQKSIQVNSKHGVAIDGVGTLNLSQGGPSDPLGKCLGTGTDLVTSGGPVLASLKPDFVTGSTSHYMPKVMPMHDPLRDVPYPSSAGLVGDPPTQAISMTDSPNYGCPVASCTLYSPGRYTNTLEVKNTTGVFKPGVYFMEQGDFKIGANGDGMMCVGCAADTSAGGTGNTGMLVYLDQGNTGVIDVGANSSTTLLGSSAASLYKGILFFENRLAISHTGAKSHMLGGGGALTLKGTIYLTNTTMTATDYQNLRFRGGSGSSTLIEGEIIVSTLDMSGTPSIQMNLDVNYLLPVDQIALVH